MHSWTPKLRHLLTGLALLGVAGAASAQLGSGTSDTPACCQLTTSLIQDVLRGNDPSGDERFFSAEGAPPNLHFIIDVSGSMRELPQINNSNYKAFYDATTNGCQNPSLDAFSDSHEWNPSFQYPVPDPGTGLGSDTGFMNLFQDTKYYAMGVWGSSSSPTPQWGSKEEACQKQIGNSWDKPSGSAQYARCLQCLSTKGYFKVFNTTSSDEANTNFILWGRFLNFNPPKYVTAKAVLKQVIKDLRRVRVGISIFTATSQNVQKMKPACNEILSNPEAFSSHRADYIARINSLAFNTSTPLARSLLNAGYYFTSSQDIYRTDFGFGNSSPLGFAYPADFKNEVLTSENRTVCWGCQSSSIILITDGEPNNDTLGGTVVTKIRELNGGKVNCPPSAPCPDASNDANYMLDDVAKLLANRDLQKNTPAVVGSLDTFGDQSLNIYTVGFGINSNLLRNTAEVGNGLYYTAEDANALKAALLSIINNVQTRSTSFSAVASNSLQVRDAGATVIPRFKPARNKAQPWQGYLYRFNLASEKVLGCVPGSTPPIAGDLNGDGDCNDTHLIDKDGHSVIENEQGDFVRLSDSKVRAVPFWEAGAVLKPAVKPNDPDDPERKMRRWKDRKVFTIIDNPDSPDGKIDGKDTPLEFSIANAGKLREYLGISQNEHECDDLKAQLGRASLTPTECAELIIQWYLGADIFTPLPAGETEPYDRPFFLQDIFHSAPVSVDPPISKFFCNFSTQCSQTLFSNIGAKNQQGYTDVLTGDAYDKYVKERGERDKIILVGSNGGMIHAFHNGSFESKDTYTGMGTYDAGTGQELWAFVPPDMLPKMRPNLGKHGYFTDGTPMVRDVWIDGSGTEVSERDAKKQWDEYRTVAVVGSGRGGVHRFALDLTSLLAENFDSEPNKVETVFQKPGVFLWMWPQPCDELSLQLGESFTNYAPMPPPLIPVAVEPATDNALAALADASDGASPQPAQPPMIANQEARERWVVLFNGGYDAFMSRGRGIAMVDIASGHTMWSFFHGDGKRRSEHLLYPFATGVTTQDIGEAIKPYQDADTLMDTATVGDFGGQMWVFRFWKPGKWDASTKKISNWFAARTFRVTPDSGNANNEEVRAPFTTMAVNAIQPGTGYMRTFIGTSDSQNLYDRGSVCRLSNPHACAVQGCSVNNTVSIKRGNTLAWNSTAPFQGKALDTAQTYSTKQEAVGACGGVEAQVSWSYAGSCGYNSSGSIKYACSGSTSSWSCAQPTNNWVTINFPNDSQPYSQYYYGFHSYGGETRRFDKLPVNGQTEDDDSAADTFETSMMLTQASLTNVSQFDNGGFENGTTEADAAGPGWFIRYAQANERTGNTGTLANGCMLWSSFEPSGASGAVCSTTGDNKARIYQADFATGRANCASSFFEDNKWKRYQTFTTVAVPPSFSTRLTMVNGQISLDLPLIAAGLKREGSDEQGVPTQELAKSDSAVKALYQIELDRKAHDCRHEGRNCDSP
ncbi:type IV pilus assembly protein PilY1 [Stigmatella aurantiaca]|uniref:Type IV pilus assembly protein PilY1 n=1 Tax=Stigmatella aurantiaca TaxID=41 RepID=A0A1H7NS23_STIAU|nr:pilus assembly protein PilY [Stigmatella aurantiaca]SEL26109.1 type IV pilus assembly protein PilY1 [Stigmatella aurantiaca]